jgi:hypothetical protein
MPNSHQSKLVSRIQRFCPEVNRVADATKPITITVTKRDVQKSSKKNPENCAMACSFKRRGWDSAIIHRSTAYLVRGDLAVRYFVPQSVVREIVSFDRHGDFRPGDYHLSAIDPSRRIGAYQPETRNVPGGTNKRAVKKPVALIRRHVTEGIR